MFVQDRNQSRDYFFQVWGKLRNRQPLEPIEAIIAEVIMLHPEYHVYLDDKEAGYNKAGLPSPVGI